MYLKKLAKHVLMSMVAVALVLSISLPSFAASPVIAANTTIELRAATSMTQSLGQRSELTDKYPEGTLLREFEDYYSDYDITVNVQYQSSGNLLTNMRNDASRAADVFISADDNNMRAAYNTAPVIIDSTTAENLLTNELVLVTSSTSGVSAGDVTYSSLLSWLTFTSGRSIALGILGTVPAGTYTKEVLDYYDEENLEEAGYTWGLITGNTSISSLYQNVGLVMTATVDKVNTLGSIYSTDAKSVGSALIELDRENVDIVYPIGLTTAATGNTARKAAAELLVDFLKDDLTKTGYADLFVFKSMNQNDRNQYSYLKTYGFGSGVNIPWVY